MPRRLPSGIAGWRAAVEAQWWRNPPGTLARLLQPLAWLYAGLFAVHRALQRPQHVPGLPVVVVGNLIAGGAGKTPAVIALVRLLRERGFSPGVISRGYGRQSDELLEVTRTSSAASVGDEPLLIHLRTGAPTWVARDRVAALQRLAQQHAEVDIVIADDGLQHHRLARVLQLIVFDERGVGNGLRLPAGPLRESLPQRVPPRSVVLYNAQAPSTPLPGFLARRSLSGAVPLADWWQGREPDAASWPALRGRPLRAVAGIGAPERFFSMLQAQGLQVERQPLPDHHAFDTLPWPAGTPDVVLTEKDAVKLPPHRAAGTRVWVVPLDFELAEGFAQAVLEHLPSPTVSPRNPR